MSVRYTPLKSKTGFRVVTLLPGVEGTPIHLNLVHTDLNLKPTYEALSYECGEASPRDPIVFIGNLRIQVYYNLWLFLNRLRTARDFRSVWIDQLSINQADTVEKAHQIQLMGEIYRGARKVLGWLGEHHSDSQLVMNERAHTFASDETRRRRMTAWSNLLQRPYFNRTWIMQELLLAPRTTLYCGPDKIHLEDLFSKPMDECFKRHINDKNGGVDVEGLPRSYLLYLERQHRHHHGFLGTGNIYYRDMDIFQLVHYHQYTECRDPLDRVYALLALVPSAEKSLDLVPNYNLTPSELFIEVCVRKLLSLGFSLQKKNEEGIIRVAMLFRGLHLSHDDAEVIVDTLFEEDDVKLSREDWILVCSTIFKALDMYGLLKPERSANIVQRDDDPKRTIIAIGRWREEQRSIGNWYEPAWQNTQVHDPPGMKFEELPEPLWSEFSILRAKEIEQAQQQQRNNMMNMINTNIQSNITQMNLQLTNNLINQQSGFVGGGGA